LESELDECELDDDFYSLFYSTS